MTDYDDILTRAVSEGLLAFQSATGSPIGCGFANLKGLDGRSGIVRYLKEVGVETHSNTYEHPDLPLSIRKDSYEGGYRLSVTDLREYADGPEFQCVDKKRPLYRAILDVLQENGVDAGAKVYTRLD